MIVQLGAFTYQKNYDFTVKLANSLKQRKKVFFVLYGDGADKAKIRDQIQKLGLENKVILNRSVANVNEILCAADGVIFPSRFEPFGIVALEAQAAGVPIAVSNVFVNELNITPLISYLHLDVNRWENWILNLTINQIHEEKNIHIVLIKVDIIFMVTLKNCFYFLKK